MTECFEIVERRNKALPKNGGYWREGAQYLHFYLPKCHPKYSVSATLHILKRPTMDGKTRVYVTGKLTSADVNKTEHASIEDAMAYVETLYLLGELT